MSANLLEGLLPVAKPNGMISKDVSRQLVRQFGRLKIGHVGTLDPGASGVLPILLGSATKLQDYLLDLPKTYRFEVAFGYETDTLDMDGQVINRSSAENVTLNNLTTVLPQFTGDIVQVPPAYSAVKVNGRPLYQYSRKGTAPGVALEELARQVKVHSLALLKMQADDAVAEFRAEVSKGTYVRCLARDIAKALGTVGTVKSLVRESAAGIALKNCVTLEQVAESGLAKCVIPVGKLAMRALSVDAAAAHKLRLGQTVCLSVETYREQMVDAGTIGVDLPANPMVSPILFVDSFGKGIGLGSAHIYSTGVVRLTVKRGLA
jgi:tRNA pseudouridine55 synthase